MPVITSRHIFAFLCLFLALGTFVSAQNNNQKCPTNGCKAGQECTQNGCTSCGQGRYSSGGFDICKLCPAGSINQQQEASQCTACTPGTYSNTAGTYCQQASAGSHVPEYNSSAQIPCKPGYHSPNSGATVCDICPCGTYNSREGATNCDRCGNVNNYPATSPAGSTSYIDCQPVYPGEYVDSSNCPHRCPDGTISTTVNSQSCINCGPNEVAPSGSSVCTPCGTGTAPDASKASCTPTSTARLSGKRSVQKCPNGYKYCPANGSRRGIFECIDVMTNIQSCGGCWSTGAGQDCTDFDDIATASCVGGKCEYSCPNGYKLTDLGCIKAAPSTSRSQRRNFGR